MARRILALIPARAGSKGLRHKNVRRIGGVPLLVRAIRLAQAAARRNEQWTIVVSTDSRHYLRMARAAGASVPFIRPTHLATDSATLIDVVIHALDTIIAADCIFDAVLMLSTTTPLTLPCDVRRALDLFRRGGGASVVSVRQDETHRSWRFGLAQGRLAGRARRVQRRQQQRETMYVLNGAIYVASPAWLRKHRQFAVAGQTFALVMPKQRCLDIEDSQDLNFAKTLLLN